MRLLCFVVLLSGCLLAVGCAPRRLPKKPSPYRYAHTVSALTLDAAERNLS
jgi:hypothetical protein